MKRVLIATLFVSFTLLLSGNTNCKDLTGYDLEGFSVSGTRSILSFKDLKLPKPIPPKSGGIETGAVFILGCYFPPPYDVTVEGIHVMINGVPCTNLSLLQETDEDRAFRGKRRIAGPLISDLRDLYQRTKFYKGEEQAEQELKKALDELKEFRLLGVDRIDEKNKLLGISAQKKHPKIDQVLEERIEIKPGETKQDVIKRHQSMNHGIVKILGYEEVYGDVKKTTVRLTHPEIGDFEVEVDGKSAEKIWIQTEGSQILQDKQYELQKKYGEFAREKIGIELKEYALSLPWVKTFEFRGSGYNAYKVNGIHGRFAIGCIPGDDKVPLPSREEIDKRLQKTAIEKTAPAIRDLLENSNLICFARGYESVKCDNDLILQIRKLVINKSQDYLSKREQLINLFKSNNLHMGKYELEFIAVFGDNWGE